jgi:methionyl-tRNA formyltransferase
LRKKIIFLGSKPIGYYCLQYLIAQAEELEVEIAGVLTTQRKEFGNEHDLAALAAEYGIPVLASIDHIPECDIIYSVQYHEILKDRHIMNASEIALNLHMAPLPEYRGANQFSFAIIENKAEFGVTIHRMESGIDSGAVLFQKRFPIPDNCWVGELYEISVKEAEKLFKQTLKHLVQGMYNLVPQDLLIGKFGTSLHYKKEIAALKVIDLNWDKEKIEKYVRATAMPGFEPPYCIIDGNKVYFSVKYK